MGLRGPQAAPVLLQEQSLWPRELMEGRSRRYPTRKSRAKMTPMMTIRMTYTVLQNPFFCRQISRAPWMIAGVWDARPHGQSGGARGARQG